MKLHSIVFVAIFPFASHVTAEPLQLRLEKAPGSKSWEKPAVISYVRQDGGDSSYNTRGTLAYSYDPKPNPKGGSDWSVGARVTWNKNNLVGSENNSYSAGIQLNYVTLLGDQTDAQNALQLSADLGASRNVLKESNAIVGGLAATLMWDPFISAKNAPLAYEILPTAGVFQKYVRNAPFDTQTNLTPTGTVRGHFGAIAVTLVPNIYERRLIAQMSTQFLRKSKDVSGGQTGNFRLSTASLGYRFNPKAKAGEFDPALTLSRQVGEDPWNEVERSGFTQLALSVKF